MLSLSQFMATYAGRRVQSPGGLGGQCVDLNELWLINLGLMRMAGNAVDFAGQLEPGADWIGNTPENVPGPGDLVVWGPYSPLGVESDGHCDIFVSGDVHAFIGFDQNWPVGSACHLVSHTYAGVLGWHHPRVLVSPTPAPIQPPVTTGPRKNALAPILLAAGAIALIIYGLAPGRAVAVSRETAPDVTPPAR